MLKKKISKNLERKKGQMKIQQMSFVLMALFIFFMLGGLFFVMLYGSGLEEKATELEEKHAKKMATKISNSPEFSCQGSYSGSQIACIDLDKVMMLKQNINEFHGFWGVAGIKIRKLHPIKKFNQDKECTRGTYPDCNVLTVFSNDVNKSGGGYSNFATLCRKSSTERGVEDKCSLGRIIVYPESKKS